MFRRGDVEDDFESGHERVGTPNWTLPVFELDRDLGTLLI